MQLTFAESSRDVEAVRRKHSAVGEAGLRKLVESTNALPYLP